MAESAHPNEPDLQQPWPTPLWSAGALAYFLVGQRKVLQVVTAGAVVPLGEPEHGHTQASVWYLALRSPSTQVRREPKVVDTKCLLQSPLADYELFRLEVGAGFAFSLVPVVQACGNHGRAIGTDHEGSHAKGADELSTPERYPTHQRHYWSPAT